MLPFGISFLCSASNADYNVLKQPGEADAGSTGSGARVQTASALPGGPDLLAIPGQGPPPRRGCNGPMQRHGVLDRRPQRDDAKGRSRAVARSVPGAADALSLAKYRLASRWQPLLRFWLSVLTVAVAVVFVLEILGPPERVAGSDPASNARGALEQPRPAAPAALSGKPVETERLPFASTPMRPEPDPPVPPGLGILPPGAPAPPEAPRARVALVVHPARAEGSAAIASRLAVQSGLAPDQVDVGSVADARSEAIIRFYATNDHPLARRLGKELARMGYSWRIENFSARPSVAKDQAIDVFLPDK